MTSAPDLPPHPTTGHPAIDAALGSVVLGEDVHDHAQQVARALDSVQRALNPPPTPPGAPGPHR